MSSYIPIQIINYWNQLFAYCSTQFIRDFSECLWEKAKEHCCNKSLGPESIH